MASIDRPAGPAGDPHSTDGTTLACLYVTERNPKAGGVGALGDYSSVESDVAHYEVPNIARFSYTSDVCALGDPWSATVPDPQGKYRERLRPGSLVEMYLGNPNVNGGELTQKLKGRILRRRIDVGDAGSVIQLDGADLGHHLKSKVPIWRSLRGATWKLLAENLIEPSWGFSGVQLGNNISLRLNNGRRAKEIWLNPTLKLDPFARIETMPGQSIADLLILYARRRALMVNVSADGYLQTFAPKYNTPSLYKLRYFDWSDPQSVENNVERLSLEEIADTIYTDVTVVARSVYTPKDIANAQATGGTIPSVAGQAGEVHQGDVHAGQSPGSYKDRTVLPYINRKTLDDGEMYTAADAFWRALQVFNRGQFDAWTLKATVRGHWQQQDWWESGTMCDVEIDTPQLKIKRALFVQRVECTRTDAGDVTRLTLKPPDLLYEIGSR